MILLSTLYLFTSVRVLAEFLPVRGFSIGDRGVQSELLEFFNIMSFNHNFIPLGGCCQWQSQLCNLHAVSNLLIAFAYYSIPACLIYCARQQANPPFNKSFVLLGACFFGGGTTHLMAVWTPPPANYLSWGRSR